MDETIEKLTTEAINKISGYPFAEQAFMLQEIAERLREEASLCIEIDFGLVEEEIQY
ncbi:MAG: hypothetical protein LBJ72_02275 [Dysgonamonadaceae bacterium]|jgi:hypothetical protein|nr:hypothetical protein [Dysgonamonadaceae bacterium]